ncbi:MAG: hypothetical protein ACYSWO_19855 [Planctomycetota bacterium]
MHGLENPRGEVLHRVRRAVRKRPVLAMTAGVGATAFLGLGIYALIRYVTHGDNVVLYVAEGSGAGEFRSSGERIAASIGAASYPVRNAQDVIDAVRRHARIKNLILLGHGTTTAFMRPGSAGIRIGADALPTWMSTTTFAREVGPRMARNGVIGWAGCSSASNPGEANWSTTYMPGGERSFIAHVRDEMARTPGVAGGIEHRGHGAPGHTTANPGGRTCYVDQPGALCTSEIDEQWGEGAHETQHNEWVSAFQGAPAEAWISGADIVV